MRLGVIRVMFFDDTLPYLYLIINHPPDLPLTHSLSHSTTRLIFYLLAFLHLLTLPRRIYTTYRHTQTATYYPLAHATAAAFIESLTCTRYIPPPLPTPIR